MTTTTVARPVQEFYSIGEVCALTELKPHVLPDAVADRCRAVSRALELPLCGLDLRLEPSGRYVCFEANPMPAFAPDGL